MLTASYYSVKGGLNTTLTLNNKGSRPLEVRPTLFGLAGERLDLAPVIVEAKSHRVLDLLEFNVAGTAFEEGSLQVVFHGKDLEMGAQVKMVDAERRLVFDEQLVEVAAKFASSRLEGVWWMPSRNADVRLVLSNTSDSGLSVNATLRGHTPRGRSAEFVLTPRETRVVDVLREFPGERGAILKDAAALSVEHSGAPGALIARAMVGDPSTGYSAPVEFADPAKARSSALHGAGLRLGAVRGRELSPVVVAHNVGQSPAVVTGRIPYTTEAGEASSAPLPKFGLAPGEVKVVDVKSALRRERLGRGVASAGLEFEHTGEPGSVVMSALSASSDGDHVFRVPLLDPAGQMSSTGGYPWRIEGDSSTVVYVKNVTTEPRNYVLEITSRGSEEGYTLGLKTIEPGQTAVVDVRRLRDEQAPDANGRTLPAEATEGQVGWSVRDKEKLVLIGRAEQADAAAGVSSTYACQNCCNDGFGWGEMSPGSVVGGIGGTTNFAANEIYVDCYGNARTPNPVFNPTFGSGDFAVATVTSGGNNIGVATAVGVGSTIINATWPAYYVSSSFDGRDWFCFESGGEGFCEASCVVTPLITNVDLASGFVGTTGEVTLTGSGFGADAEVQVSGDGITVTIISKDSVQIKVNIAITAMATVGSRNLKVRSGGQDSNTVTFTVARLDDITASGATKITSITGNPNLFHFVTPKGAGSDQVTLTATVTPNIPAVTSALNWVGATENTSNPLQATIPKNAAAKVVVQLVHGPATPVIVKESRVWVVWANLAASGASGPNLTFTGTIPNQVNTRVGASINWTATIDPATLITDADRPNLSGANASPPPGSGTTLGGLNLSGGANARWDISRRIRQRYFINGTEQSVTGIRAQVSAYPTDDRVGNDDGSTGDEDNNPYVAPNVGALTSVDSPVCEFSFGELNVGDTIELRIQFGEFARLELNGVWSRISDFANWRLHINYMKVSDTQLVPVGTSGPANANIVGPGADGALQTGLPQLVSAGILGGDDTLASNFVTSGPNGIAQTTAVTNLWVVRNPPGNAFDLTNNGF